MRKYIIVCASLLLSIMSFAQRENTLFMLPSLSQSTYVNPTSIPQHKVSIGLPIPSTYFHVTNSGFSFSELVDGNTLDYNKLTDVLGDDNLISTGAQVDLFSLRFKVRHNYFSFNVTEHVDFDFSYPKDLFGLALSGNASYEGGTIDLSGLKINMSQYREYGFGYNRDGKRWQYGGRVKLLFGKANVSTVNSDITIDVADETLNHTINANLQLNTASPLPLPTDLATLNEDNLDSLLDLVNEEDLILNSQNWGLAFDAGVGYKFNRKLEFSASLLNLGFIRWKQNARNYTFEGDAAVTGVDVLPALLDNQELDGDSIADVFIEKSVATGTEESYTTRLTYQVNLSARYQLWKSTHVYGLYNIMHFKRWRGAFTVGVSHDILRYVSIALSNTSYHGEAINVGLGLVLKPGPFQFYIVGDNFDSLLRPVSPSNLTEKTFALRIGMNLVFGRVMPEDKLQTTIR
ncbi:MAG: hypothetical protein GY827_05755 [Cytophagales bacterium]|nr:hypothetical protein [Cytophagales bacterium]